MRLRPVVALVSLTLAVIAACAHAPPKIPEKASELNTLCAQLMEAGNLDKAELYCDHALEFWPEYSDALTNKGIIALRRNQIAPAKDLFIHALRINNEQAQALNDLGYIYLKDHQYGKAHDQFQRALKVNPDFIEARYNLALAYKSLGDRASARKEYRTVLIIDPNLADPHNDLCLMAFEDRAYDEAIAECIKATQLYPKFAEGWQNLGTAYLEAGKFAEAVDAFTSCIEADTNNPVCRNDVVIAKRKAELLAPELKEMERDRGLPTDAPTLYQRAMIFKARSLREEEERVLKKCVKTNAKYPPCHYELFQIQSEDHRDDSARSECQLFLKYAVADEFPKEVEACQRYVNMSGE